jgi:hypothetical protein
VCAEFWCGVLRVRVHLEELDVNGKIIFKWIFKQLDGKAWTGLMWLRIGKGTCECGNKPLDYIKFREFFG